MTTEEMIEEVKKRSEPQPSRHIHSTHVFSDWSDAIGGRRIRACVACRGVHSYDQRRGSLGLDIRVDECLTQECDAFAKDRVMGNENH